MQFHSFGTSVILMMIIKIFQIIPVYRIIVGCKLKATKYQPHIMMCVISPVLSRTQFFFLQASSASSFCSFLPEQTSIFLLPSSGSFCVVFSRFSNYGLSFKVTYSTYLEPVLTLLDIILLIWLPTKHIRSSYHVDITVSYSTSCL